MTKIFISYRRADSQETTDYLHNQMCQHFGEPNVFQDVDNIPFGVDFRKYLRDEIAKCDVVLVIIGKDWVRIMAERAHEAADFVRIEVENALKLGKLVIPVTVRGAEMPTPAQLPESIGDICWLNRAVVRPNPDFKHDCQRLADGIKRFLGEVAPKSDPVQDALTRARDFHKTGKRNADWKPFITTFPDLKIPDMRFCLVPTGAFQMGSNDGYDDENPIHPQMFDKPFYIAQYPVTNAQWTVAVKAGAVNEPKDALDWYNDPQMANAPVVGVSWHECQKFVKLVGCRLPTEREWEYSARGVDALKFPWGNDFIADNVVYHKNSGNQPNNVETKEAGASWVGASHLSGNVWEWCSSIYSTYPYAGRDGREDLTVSTNSRVVRGGSWGGSDSSEFLATMRYRYHPSSAINTRGFRCALS